MAGFNGFLTPSSTESTYTKVASGKGNGGTLITYTATASEMALDDVWEVLVIGHEWSPATTCTIQLSGTGITTNSASATVTTSGNEGSLIGYISNSLLTVTSACISLQENTQSGTQHAGGSAIVLSSNSPFITSAHTITISCTSGGDARAFLYKRTY